MINKKIAVIGCGNLGSAIISGLLESNSILAADITATRRNITRLKHFEDQGIIVTSDNIEATKNCDIIILGLKPYNILKVIKEIQPYLDPQRHILVSLASGISLAELEESTDSTKAFFRAMPNTAADVKQAMTCLSTNSTDDEVIESVKQCFDSIGESIIINDSLMDSATVLGACGIAYVLRFIRGMIQGGIEIGFDAKTASTIVTQTVKGAAELLIERQQHPEQEIDKVTTPKGCTIAGLNEMEHNGFSSALIKGITTSFEKI